MRNVWLRNGLVLGLSMLAGCAPRYAQFGNPMTLTERRAISVDRLLADPEAFDGQYVRVVGTVGSVGEDRGDWLTLVGADGARRLLVQFTCPVEGCLIPPEAAGHRAIIEGTVELVEVTSAEARQPGENGEPADANEATASMPRPPRAWRVISSAARIEGLR
jgi:hypothetical protein